MADVIVVDDSQFMRVQIAEILEEGGHSVLKKAQNGKAAIDAVREHQPDVVTMDVKMPGMDGIEAVEEIMASHPTPVVMLSKYTEEGAETTLEALDAGAVDFMMKPQGTGLVKYADELVELVGVVASADLDSQPTASMGKGAPTETEATDISQSSWETPPTVVIAASTGGPAELHSILGSIPATTGMRLLVVQHMPAQFTDRFANRLDTISELAVTEAEMGGRVGPNEAVVAPGGKHLEVTRDTGNELVVELSEDPPVHNVRPAADVTFESAVEHASGPIVGIVLSGMGRDGAAGIKRVSTVGGSAIAQSPDSASISAMPERAIETDCVDMVVPGEEIPEALIDTLESIA